MSGKRISIYLVALIIAVAAFLWYRAGNEQKIQSGTPSVSESAQSIDDESAENDVELSAAEEAAMELEDANFNERCVNGEWEKIAEVRGNAVTLAGKLRRVYPEDDIPAELKAFQFYVDGKEKTSLSGADLTKLESFEDREVEVQGAKSANGKSVEVSQVRCAGAETDKTSIESRDKLLNWLAENINSIAPNKAPYQKWTIDTAEFVDGKNVYVEYYDAVEDDENATLPDDVDTTRMALFETSAKSDGGYGAKVLAYWEMGEEDYDLKSGTDKFEEIMDTTFYQFDFEDKSWTRI